MGLPHWASATRVDAVLRAPLPLGKDATDGSRRWRTGCLWQPRKLYSAKMAAILVCHFTSSVKIYTPLFAILRDPRDEGARDKKSTQKNAR